MKTKVKPQSKHGRGYPRVFVDGDDRNSNVTVEDGEGRQLVRIAFGNGKPYLIALPDPIWGFERLIIRSNGENKKWIIDVVGANGKSKRAVVHFFEKFVRITTPKDKGCGARTLQKIFKSKHTGTYGQTAPNPDYDDTED